MSKVMEYGTSEDKVAFLEDIVIKAGAAAIQRQNEIYALTKALQFSIEIFEDITAWIEQENVSVPPELLEKLLKNAEAVLGDPYINAVASKDAGYKALTETTAQVAG